MNINKQNILITGSTGFVGKSFVKYIAHADRNLYLLNRSGVAELEYLPNIYSIECATVESFTGKGLPQKLDVIVHLAGLAHVNNKHVDKGEHLKVNIGGAVAVKNIAIKTGVKHVIFISSIKVNGNGQRATAKDLMTECDAPAPTDPYSESKYESEQILASLIDFGIRVSIIRPPLIYGPNVKANMRTLFNFIKISPVIPFKSFEERRSLLGIDNLNDFMSTMISNSPIKPYTKKTFIIADNQAVNLTELCSSIAGAMEKKIWNIRVPTYLLKIVFNLLGKKEQFENLSQSLEVKSQNASEYYSWSPPTTLQEGLSKIFSGESR